MNRALVAFWIVPSLGSNREFERMLRQSFKAWQNYRRADFDYQLVVVEAWIKTFEQFQQKLLTLTENGEMITSLEQFVTVWTNLAEDAFSEVFRSEKYIRAQGKLLETTMNYRIQQRQIVEWLCEKVDIPTRSEVDEVHRTNYELRKEVKALKKAVASSGRKDPAVTVLQEEVQALKAAVAELSKKPRSTSRARSTKKTTANKQAGGA